MNIQAQNQSTRETEIADWVQIEFSKATKGDSEAKKEGCTSILLGDRSMLPECEVFLIMTDASDNVCLMHRLAIVPSLFQTTGD